MKKLFALAIFQAVVIAFSGCTQRASSEANLDFAATSIESSDLLTHIGVLAADDFEGRAPGTIGEEKTVGYLSSQFAAVGLSPGSPDGTFVQQVPLVEITPRLEASFERNGTDLGLLAPQDFVVHSMRAVPEVAVQDSEVVFVGYGVTAPEYGWDDFKGVDVRGKTLLMLVNDPQIPEGNDPSKLDSSVFKGREMTYYGRWTYKYEIATEKGAAAVLVIHETGPAGYPYEVVSRDFGLPQFDVEKEGNNVDRVAFEGWINREAAVEMFESAGLDFEEMKRQALSRSFEPVALGVKADFHAENRVRKIESHNVVGKLPGSDPEVSDEYLIYMAHWDHLGRDPNLQGDQIFNGALDNATGTSALIELAEAFSLLSPAPRRSVLFLALTAEEYGLLGAKYYTSNPLYPLEKTVAAVNMDGLNQWGPTLDMVAIGYGKSTLDDKLREELKKVNRRLRPDPEPEKGYFYRSDHFHFAKQGVPALYTDSGLEFIGKPEGFGKEMREEYIANDYHQVTDEIKAEWDLTGAAQDLRVLMKVGFAIAQDDEIPLWNPGAEFKTVREEMMK